MATLTGLRGDAEDATGAGAAVAPGPSSLIDRLDQALTHATLFGPDAEGPPKLGRFVVVRKVGAGGMGVIYEAYDPKLDRKVAVKLMRAALGSSDADTPTRLLREAQALAKLSHANVVAVFDVGMFDEHVWLAMELVDGQTLSDWANLHHRDGSEILAVMTQAGRGLAAAHAAGLVHRDFKPDNVMISKDGRVRVVDFGLAHGAAAADRPPASVALHPDVDALSTDLTRTGSIRGTPAYMAPEQWNGDEAGPPADQFAWSITTWELLFGEPPFVAETHSSVRSWRRRPQPRGRSVPSWMRRIVERGLYREPSRRWPSMTTLLDAVDRERRHARMRTGALSFGGVAALAVAIAGYRHWDHTQAEAQRLRQHNERVAACHAAGATIGEVWDEEAREALSNAFLATGAKYAHATVDRVLPRLTARATEWQEARTTACLRAEVDGAWDQSLYDRALWCLEEQSTEFTALVAEFRRADTHTVRQAVSAAASLRSVDACLDESLLLRQDSPPPDRRDEIGKLRAELSRARSLGLAGNYADALARTRATRTSATNTVDWPPLLAAAHAQEGHLLEKMGAYEEAAAASTDAYYEAAAAGAWATAANAAIDMIYVEYRRARHADGRRWARDAAMAGVHAGDPMRLRESFRLNNLAAIHLDVGEYAVARALLSDALSIRARALGPDHPGVGDLLDNLATVHFQLHELAAARRLCERGLAIARRAFGNDHPDIASELTTLGSVLWEQGSYAEARALHENALAISEAAFGSDHPSVAMSLLHLALVDESTGEFVEAQASLERALSINEATLGPRHIDVAVTLNNLANVSEKAGALKVSLARRQRVLTIFEAALGRDHRNTNTAVLNLANAHFRLAEYQQARALYERALASTEATFGPDHPQLALILNNLGALLKETKATAQARAMYTRALKINETAFGPDHPDVAMGLMNLAALSFDDRNSRPILPLVERAVRILAASKGVQHGEANARFSLARLLVVLGEDHERAIAEARQAREDFASAGPSEAPRVAEVDAWLMKHGRAR